MQYTNLAEVLQAWESGELDALEAHIELKKLEDQLKSATETVRPFVRVAAERRYEGTKAPAMIVRGMEVKLAETGTKWDYSGCGCARLAALQEAADRADAALKNRQKYLQGLAEPERNIDPETGEPTEAPDLDLDGNILPGFFPQWIAPARKTSTSFVTVSVPKEPKKGK